MPSTRSSSNKKRKVLPTIISYKDTCSLDLPIRLTCKNCERKKEIEDKLLRRGRQQKK